MSRTLFSARAGRLCLWLGGAMDCAILTAVAKKRTPGFRPRPWM
jgi:hypothetical protein